MVVDAETRADAASSQVGQFVRTNLFATLFRNCVAAAMVVGDKYLVQSSIVGYRTFQCRKTKTKVVTGQRKDKDNQSSQSIET